MIAAPAPGRNGARLPVLRIACLVPGCLNTFASVNPKAQMCPRCRRVLERNRQWVCLAARHQGPRILGRYLFGKREGNRMRMICKRCRALTIRENRPLDVKGSLRRCAVKTRRDELKRSEGLAILRQREARRLLVLAAEQALATDQRKRIFAFTFRRQP